jgi:hypothetical protein
MINRLNSNRNRVTNRNTLNKSKTNNTKVNNTKVNNTKVNNTKSNNKVNNNKLDITINPSYNKYKSYQYLIVICAGDESLHYKKKWFSESRKYVLCVIYYGDNKEIEEKYKRTSDIVVNNKGPKWSLIRGLLIKWKDWKSFKFVAFPDDDLDISVTKLNKLFIMGDKYKFDLFQPSLVDNGPNYVVHNVLKTNKKCKFRYTDFVEIMIPIFSIKALTKSYHILVDPKIKSAWGIDYVIPSKILHRRNIAVVDSISVIHTKPLGALNLQKLSTFYKTFNIDPEKELNYFLKKYKSRTYKGRTLKCVV